MSPKDAPRLYTANYCEENIWHLAADATVAEGSRFVVLLTSLAKSTPLWQQKAAPGEDNPVFWDYHVILIVESRTGSVVYDFDTRLPFPCGFADYASATFDQGQRLPFNYHPRFRVMTADEYRQGFWSDRSHMKLKDGAWRSPPPSWAPITPAKPTLRLPDALDLRKPGPGQLMDLAGLKRRFGPKA